MNFDTITDVHIVIDHRASQRAGTPTGLTSSSGGSHAAPADSLFAAAAMHPTPTAWVSRSGVAFIIGNPGSGRVIYDGTKPTAPQRRAIDAIHEMIATAYPHLKVQVATEPDDDSTETTVEPEPAQDVWSDDDGSTGE